MAIINVPGVGNIGVGANSTNGKITQAAVTPVPTWQDKLAAYKTDAAAAQAEIQRAKDVYAQKQAAGDTAGMAAANKWANQVRDASGISVNDSVYGNNKETFGKPVTPVTPVVTPVVPVNPVPEVVVNNGGGGGGGGGSSSTTTYIDGIIAARKAAALANLEKSKNAALSNLEAEKATIAPMYYDKRNQTAATNQQQARNFAEFMAARGMTGSGANAQAEISRSGVYQANIGALNNQESAANTDIARRTTDVNNAYESDLTAAQNEIEASRLQALLEQFNQDRNFNLSEANVTGMYNGKQTAQGLQNQLSNQKSQYDLNQLTDTNSITNQQKQAELLKTQLSNQIEQVKANNASSVAKAELDKLQYAVQKGLIDATTAKQKLDNLSTEIANANALAVAKIGTQNAKTATESTVQSKNNASASASNASAALSGAKTKAVNNPTVKPTPTKTTKPTTKDLTAEYVTNIDNMSPSQKVIFFKDNKTTIIKQLGLSGYNSLKKQYNIK